MWNLKSINKICSYRKHTTFVHKKTNVPSFDNSAMSFSGFGESKL